MPYSWVIQQIRAALLSREGLIAHTKHNYFIDSDQGELPFRHDRVDNDWVFIQNIHASKVPLKYH